MSNAIYFICGGQEHLSHAPTGRLGFGFDPEKPSILAPDWVDSGDFMVLQDHNTPTYPLSSTLVHLLFQLCQRDFSGLICDFEQTPSPFFGQLLQKISPLLQQHHIPLWVPISYQNHVSYGNFILQTALQAGDFQKQLQSYGNLPSERLTLELSCVPMDCPMGTRDACPLSPAQLVHLQQVHHPSIHHSGTLQCKYFSYVAEDTHHLVCFHDKTSLQARIHTANQLGIYNFMGLYQELYPFFHK